MPVLSRAVSACSGRSVCFCRACLYQEMHMVCWVQCARQRCSACWKERELAVTDSTTPAQMPRLAHIKLCLHADA